MKRYPAAFFALASLFTAASPALAQAPQAAGGEPNYAISWALILLCAILGLIVTLKSSGRKTEFRR